jgi:protein-L-isoaspartate(D-aspartate) O-methyltransferase
MRAPRAARRRTITFLALAALPASPVRGQDAYADARARMLQTISRQVRELASDIGRAKLADPVVRAMERVPRHRFVPADLADLAYANRPLPIGEGQTISQPFIVALMTDLLEPRPHHRVLEVGTGSGYQAAVLAECVAKVYTIEILARLGERAKAVLAELGYRNVETRIGDGYAGWPEAAPFDGIVVTAAPDHIPPALVEQLAPGGHLVIPVGTQSVGQDLLVIRKEADGRTVTRRTLPVRFVPLTGAGADARNRPRQKP